MTRNRIWCVKDHMVTHLVRVTPVILEHPEVPAGKLHDGCISLPWFTVYSLLVLSVYVHHCGPLGVCSLCFHPNMLKKPWLIQRALL